MKIPFGAGATDIFLLNQVVYFLMASAFAHFYRRRRRSRKVNMSLGRGEGGGGEMEIWTAAMTVHVTIVTICDNSDHL